MAAAKASIPTASGTDSSLWDHLRQSPMTERPLWKVLLAPVFERHKRGQQSSAQRAGVWAGGRARGAGILQTDGRDRPEALTYDLRTK